MMTRKWMTAAAALVLAGGVATVALAGDGEQGARGGWRRRARMMMQQRRGRALAFVQSLQFTDQQRQTMLDKARLAAPIAEAARVEGRKIVAQAWAQASKAGTTDRAALRAQVRDQLKALRAKTWPQIETLANDVVATLTPEQRQKIQDLATKHGKTADDAKLAKFMGRLITRPMAVPFLEARLGVSAPK